MWHLFKTHDVKLPRDECHKISEVSIGSRSGLMPPGNKLLLESLCTYLLGHIELKMSLLTGSHSFFISCAFFCIWYTWVQWKHRSHISLLLLSVMAICHCVVMWMEMAVNVTSSRSIPLAPHKLVQNGYQTVNITRVYQFLDTRYSLCSVWEKNIKLWFFSKSRY